MSYSASAPKIGTSAPKCPTCGKSVYFNEQVLALEKAWHKRCLKCAQCSKVLDAGMLNDREGKIYCNPCYSAVSGIKGFGRGGAESHVSGGAAGTSAGAEVLQGAAAGTPVATGALGGAPAPAAAAAPAARFCASCGAVRPSADARFCPGCGSQF